jgi:competence protein ComEC
MATNEWRAPSIAERPRQSGLFARLSDRLEALFEAERDQLPLWLPVGLGAGIAAWFALPDLGAWLAFLFAATGAAAAGLALGASTRWGRAIALFCLALAIGCGLIWSRAENAAAPRLDRARAADFTGRIVSVQRIPAREVVRLVVAPSNASLPDKVRVNIDSDKIVTGLQPGAIVQVKAWLMPPPPMAVPGSYDFARSAWFQGIGGTGRAHDVRLVEAAGEPGWRARLAGWRQRLADHVRERLPGGEGAIAAALATGDQGGIPEADAERCAVPGSLICCRSADSTSPQWSVR